MEMFPDAAGPAGSAGPAVRRLSLIRLSAEIARSMAAIGTIAVEGEVVQPSTSRSRAVFFTLRDRAAQITVVCPPAKVRRCRTVHGERVSVTGSLIYANDRGQLRLVAEEVTPVGEGAILAAIGEVRRRLAAEGLLDRPRRPVPVLPAVVGVVCGTDAAVRADIESVVAARFPGYPVAFSEVAVSGPGAADAVADALRAFDARSEVEVVILARGGGDPASLLPFSDEELCRAVCACAAPVVTAIGHERDRPLCDEVADLRCGTPSLAASAVIPDEGALRAHIDALLESVAEGCRAGVSAGELRLGTVDLHLALRSGLDTAAERLGRAGRQLELVDLPRRTGEAGRRLAAVDWRSPLPGRLDTLDGDLAGRRRTLEALDPARVVSRGYAVVRGPDGAVVRSPAQVGPGDVLDVAVARGAIRAEVVKGSAEGEPGGGGR